MIRDPGSVTVIHFFFECLITPPLVYLFVNVWSTLLRHRSSSQLVAHLRSGGWTLRLTVSNFRVQGLEGFRVVLTFGGRDIIR